MKIMGNIKNKKSILPALITVIIFIIMVLILALSFVFKSSDKAPSLFGYSIYIMDGDGMEPHIRDGCAVFVKNKKLPTNEDAKYQVALCNIVNDKFSTVLRVCDVVEKDGKVSYLMKSDKNEASQMITVPSDKVIGVAEYESMGFGKAVRFVTSRVGIIILVIIPCIGIVVYQLVRILKKVKNNDTDFGVENIEAPENKEEAEESTPVFQDMTPVQNIPSDQEENITSLTEFEALENKTDDNNEAQNTEEPQNQEKASEQEKDTPGEKTDILPDKVSENETYSDLDYSPKAKVNDRGEAEYNKKEPTANQKSLDDVLFKYNEDDQVEKKTPAAPKSFEFKAEPEDFDKIKKPPMKSAKPFDNYVDPFIPPRNKQAKKKKTSNQQIEELMHLMDKK